MGNFFDDPVEDKKKNFFDDPESQKPYMVGLGGLELPVNMITGLGASATAGIRGIYDLATGSSLDEAANNVNQTQNKYTYQPRTLEGSAMTEIAGKPLEWMGKGAGKILGGAGKLVGGHEGRMIGESIGEAVVPMGAAVMLGRGAIKARRSSVENSAALDLANKQQLAIESSNQAPILDSQQAALEIGAKLNPVDTNPTLKNRVVGQFSGGRHNANIAISQANEPLWASETRSALNLPDGTPLTSETYNAFREGKAAPYNEIAQIPRLEIDQVALKNDLYNTSNFRGLNTEAANYLLKKSGEIRSTVESIANSPEGLNGKTIIEMVKDLRKDANSIYNNKGPIDPTQRGIAEASLSSANALENILDRNLTRMEQEYPGMGAAELLQELKDSRRAIAQSYIAQDATLLSGKVDPKRIAAKLDNGIEITGPMERIGRIAGINPDIAQIDARQTPMTHLARSSVGGAVGAAIGQLVGAPTSGFALGALGQYALETPFQKMMMREAYQRANAMAPDYRSYLPAVSQAVQQPASITQTSTPHIQLPMQPPSIDTMPIIPGTRLSMTQDVPYEPLQMPVTEAPFIPGSLGASVAARINAAGIKGTPNRPMPPYEIQADQRMLPPSRLPVPPEPFSDAAAPRTPYQGYAGVQPTIGNTGEMPYVNKQGATLSPELGYEPLNMPSSIEFQGLPYSKSALTVDTVAPIVKEFNNRLEMLQGLKRVTGRNKYYEDKIKELISNFESAMKSAKIYR